MLVCEGVTDKVYGWGCRIEESSGDILCDLAYLKSIVQLVERKGQTYNVPSGDGFCRNIRIELFGECDDG